MQGEGGRQQGGGLFARVLRIKHACSKERKRGGRRWRSEVEAERKRREILEECWITCWCKEDGDVWVFTTIALRFSSMITLTFQVVREFTLECLVETWLIIAVCVRVRVYCDYTCIFMHVCMHISFFMRTVTITKMIMIIVLAVVIIMNTKIIITSGNRKINW